MKEEITKNKKLLWIEMHRNNIMLTIKLVGIFLTIIMMAQAILGLATFASFINQESIQNGGFSWSMPMMNKEFELALATLKMEEPHYKDNAQAIIQCWDLKAIINPIRLYRNMRRSLVEFARTAQRKIESDKGFLKHMIRKQKHDEYLASLNHKVYK